MVSQTSICCSRSSSSSSSISRSASGNQATRQPAVATCPVSTHTRPQPHVLLLPPKSVLQLPFLELPRRFWSPGIFQMPTLRGIHESPFPVCNFRNKEQKLQTVSQAEDSKVPNWVSPTHSTALRSSAVRMYLVYSSARPWTICSKPRGTGTFSKTLKSMGSLKTCAVLR